MPAKYLLFFNERLALRNATILKDLIVFHMTSIYILTRNY